MTRYEIVPDRSRIDVTARPALPGVRLVVQEVAGSVEVPEHGDATGEVTMWVQAMIEEDRATTLPPWLADGDGAVAGQVTAVRCTEDRLELEVRLGVGDRTVPITGAGRLHRPDGPDGSVEAVGISVVDPRVLGFPLPPLVTYVLHTRWSLTLVSSRSADAPRSRA